MNKIEVGSILSEEQLRSNYKEIYNNSYKATPTGDIDPISGSPMMKIELTSSGSGSGEGGVLGDAVIMNEENICKSLYVRASDSTAGQISLYSDSGDSSNKSGIRIDKEAVYLFVTGNMKLNISDDLASFYATIVAPRVLSEVIEVQGTGENYKVLDTRDLGNTLSQGINNISDLTINIPKGNKIELLSEGKGFKMIDGQLFLVDNNLNTSMQLSTKTDLGLLTSKITKLEERVAKLEGTVV
jgi:hypothetical protein